MRLMGKNGTPLCRLMTNFYLRFGIDAAVKSHTHAFIASGCDPHCTRAQLEAYYKNIGCPEDARLKMVDENGKPIKPDVGDIF
jgi:hypothetical protein